jgi:hypothetical protein
MAPTGHSSMQAPQSMQATGSMYSIGARSKSPAGVGRMQSTGQTGTQLASLQQFWVMT